MQGRQRMREAAEAGGQGRRGYFNLINDRTPLRVCFNNQDTLQQVDRMFAVNLHMSSVRAVNINNTQEQDVPYSLSCSTQVAPLSPGGCRSHLVSGGQHFGQGTSSLGRSQVSPPK